MLPGMTRKGSSGRGEARAPLSRKRLAGSILIAVAVIASMGAARGSTQVVSSFTPGGQLISVGYDPLAGTLYTYTSSSAHLVEWSTTGSVVRNPAFARPGASSNDFDLSFAPEAFRLIDTDIPANSILAFNGDSVPASMYAINKSNGAVRKAMTMPTSFAKDDLVGGTYHAGRHTLFAVDWQQDAISEINPADGSVVRTFPVRPAGSPTFDVYFGDIEVNPNSGTLFVVSSAQARIRELAPDGTFIADHTVTGVSSMSGIAFTGQPGEAWISDTGGNLRRLSGVGSVEVCDNGADDDHDGLVDSSDPECPMSSSATQTTSLTIEQPPPPPGVLTVSVQSPNVGFGSLQSGGSARADVGGITYENTLGNGRSWNAVVAATSLTNGSSVLPFSGMSFTPGAQISGEGGVIPTPGTGGTFAGTDSQPGTTFSDPIATMTSPGSVQGTFTHVGSEITAHTPNDAAPGSYTGTLQYTITG